jgi:hypothetical protein
MYQGVCLAVMLGTARPLRSPEGTRKARAALQVSASRTSATKGRLARL